LWAPWDISWGVLLEIPCEPNGRKLTVSKLPDDFIPAMENISKGNRVVTPRSVFLDRFHIIIDALESSFPGHSKGQILRMESIGCEVPS
jgi:hypothetical protein